MNSEYKNKVFFKVIKTSLPFLTRIAIAISEKQAYNFKNYYHHSLSHCDYLYKY